MKKNLIVATLMAAGLWTGLAQADVLKPIKTSRADVAGAAFSRPDAVKAVTEGTPTVDVVRYESKDGVFQNGLYKSGPMREALGAPGTAYDEFLYFISGSVTLTSSDGSVMTVGPGESVTLPKGWTGVFETKGYEKIYVIYDAAAKKP
ncbi:cupin domain-containing protein [Pseudomonas sp. SDO528_S397]